MTLEDHNYYFDRRTAAAMRTKPHYDERTNRLVVLINDEEDEDNEVYKTLPSKFEVCPLCAGRGKHVNPAIDAGGLTREDFDEDPDFAEDYFAGAYDVPCYECKGQRVVPVPDEALMFDDEKETYAVFLQQEKDEHDYQRLCAAERAMGA
jgi:hypothetical protein